MPSVKLFRTALLVVIVATSGCKERPTDKAEIKSNPSPSLDKHCFDDLPKGDPIKAARTAYDRGDHRILVYDQYGEGNYPVAPSTEAFELTTTREWQPGFALKVVMPREQSRSFECVADCDYPPSACGIKKQEWLGRYNAQICRRASAVHLGHCGVKYVQSPR